MLSPLAEQKSLTAKKEEIQLGYSLDMEYFAHIEIWSQARFSPSLDLGTFRFREFKTSPAFRDSR
jgi:hypothetical protein